MPGMNMPAQDYLATLLRDLQIRVGRLERQSLYVVSDPNGNVRTELGLLSNGDYGVSVVDTLGNSTEILPVTQDYAAGPITTTNTTPTAVAGLPSVTTMLGARKAALVRISGNITLPSANTTTTVGGWMGVYMNGTYVGIPMGAQFDVNSSYPFGGGIISVFAENYVTATAPGEYTVTLQMYSYSGQSISFDHVGLTCTPL